MNEVLDELLASTPDHNKFASELAAWLNANARTLDINGSYNDVHDAADALQRAAGE